MDENTRPWYTIDELSEWIDKYQNQEWRNAAIMLGEELASVGPVGYYEMDANEWFDWAVLKVRPRTWAGLSDDEIKEIIGPYGDAPIKGYTRKLFDQIEAKLRSKNT